MPTPILHALENSQRCVPNHTFSLQKLTVMEKKKQLSFTTAGSKKVLSPPSASKHHVAQQSVL